jgi:L-2-hydroxyglutarate oxidase LhgO
MVTWSGFPAIARQHWKAGVSEYAGSFSRRVFMNRARRLLPIIKDEDVVRGGSGIRAQAVARDGSFVDDFVVNHLGKVTAVRNAPSPAATSSLAIAELIGDEVLGHAGSSKA